MPETEEGWKKKLGPEKYRIMRERGTEAPFTGDLLKNKGSGKYVCGACGAELFSSDTKFDSGTGWPSFTEANKKNVILNKDMSHGMIRTEVICKNCGGHLGHVFDDGPPPSGKRYCINGITLTFKSA